MLTSEAKFDSLLPYLLKDSEVVKSLLTDGYAVIPDVLSEEECEDGLEVMWEYLSTVGRNVDRNDPTTWYPRPHRTWGNMEDPWPQTYQKSFPDMQQNCGAGWMFGRVRELVAKRVFEDRIFGTDQLLCSKEGFTARRPLSVTITRSDEEEKEKMKKRRQRKKKQSLSENQSERTTVLLHPRQNHDINVCGKPQKFSIGEHYDQAASGSGVNYIQSSVSFVDQDSEGKDGCFMCWPKSFSKVHQAIVGQTYRGTKSKCWVPLTDEELYRLRDEYGLERKLVPVRKGSVIVWRSDLVHAAAGPMMKLYENVHDEVLKSGIRQSNNFRMVAYMSMIPARCVPNEKYDSLRKQKIEAYLTSRTGDHRPDIECWHSDWGQGQKLDQRSEKDGRVRLVKTYQQLSQQLPKLTIRQAELYGLIPYEECNNSEGKIKMLRHLADLGVKFSSDVIGCKDLQGKIHPSLRELRHKSGEDMLGQDKWLGGMPSPCGKYVYGVPGTHPRVLRITCETGEVDYIGDHFKGPFKWLRGIEVPAEVMGKDAFPLGCCIALPCNALSVLRIDPYTSEVITFGKLEGTWMYHGGALASDGMIYAIPANAQRVLKIDPRTLETTFIGPNYEGGQKWYGGLLAANGSIYGIPQNASGIIKINPTTQEVSIIGQGTLPEGEWKWHGGITTTDQKLIYGFPNNANQVLKLDTETDTIELIGDESVIRSGRHRVPQDNKYKYLGGAIAPNGRIFLFPCDAERVLSIDSNTDEVRCVGPAILDGENKYQNGFCAKDSCCYAIPQRARGVLKISCVDDEVIVDQLDCGDEMAKYKEKFEGGVMCNGEIYCIPMRAKSVIKILPDQNPPILV